jgi:hypothetical protein
VRPIRLPACPALIRLNAPYSEPYTPRSSARTALSTPSTTPACTPSAASRPVPALRRDLAARRHRMRRVRTCLAASSDALSAAASGPVSDLGIGPQIRDDYAARAATQSPSAAGGHDTTCRPRLGQTPRPTRCQCLPCSALAAPALPHGPAARRRPTPVVSRLVTSDHHPSAFSGPTGAGVRFCSRTVGSSASSTGSMLPCPDPSPR